MNTNYCIDEQGKCIKGNLTSRKNFASSLPLIEDIRIISIECIKPGQSSFNAIGIISDIEQCKSGNKWIYWMYGYKYWWQQSNSIYGQRSFQVMHQKDVRTPWKPNDIITIKLDRNEWVITFYSNDKEQYQMPLQQDHDYFLIMSVCKEFEYRLLS